MPFAPSRAYFIHFDALLKSPGERLEEMRRYESDRPNAGFMVGYHYLPELFPELNHRWKKLDTSDLSDLFASLPTPVHNDAQLTSEERAESHRLSTENWRNIIQRRKQRWPSDSVFANKSFAEFICTIASCMEVIQTRCSISVPLTRHLRILGDEFYYASAQ